MVYEISWSKLRFSLREAENTPPPMTDWVKSSPKKYFFERNLLSTLFCSYQHFGLNEMKYILNQSTPNCFITLVTTTSHSLYKLSDSCLIF